MKARNFAAAVIIAVVLALPFVQPTIGHIETWKVILGMAGLLLFFRAGMSR